MYSQKYIEPYNEKYLFDILLGKYPGKVDANKTDLDSKRLYYIFQHFLVKCYTNGIYKRECALFLLKMYDDILVKPYAYVDSPLMKNNVLDALIGDNQYKDKIKSVRDKYFDSSVVSQLYRKNKIQELSNDEKNQLYSFLLLHINNSKYSKIIDDAIISIINKNQKIFEMNEMELKFYCQYVSNFALRNRNIRNINIIGTERASLNGNQLASVICINKNSYNQNIEALTQTICHESRHSIQEYESLASNTRAGFDMAQRILFSKYLNAADYDSYNKNYRYSLIELDAEKSGHWNASVFFTMFNRNDLADIIRQKRVENLDKRNYYSYMITPDGKRIPVEKYIVLYMDQIIKDNPFELEKYPVLKQIYNVDGKRKEFSELFYSRADQDIDNRGIYDNYIDYGIAVGELENLDFTNVDSSIINKFFKTLSYIYRDKMIMLKDYYNDNPNTDDNHVKVTVGYHINQLYRILSYVNDNYELIIKSLDEKMSNRSFIFDFIYDLRDFTVEQIKNDKIKNNPELISRIHLLQNLTNEVIKKFNSNFLISRLEDFSESELNNMIFVDGYGNISLKDYLFKIVLPNMDGHQEIIINGCKVYVGDIITNYRKGIPIKDYNNKI